MTTADEAQAAFDAMLTCIACPNCGESYSDAAVQWCKAWIEGRHDLLVEMNSTERDGPVKIRCEQCASKAWIDYFNKAAMLVHQ